MEVLAALRSRALSLEKNFSIIMRESKVAGEQGCACGMDCFGNA